MAWDGMSTFGALSLSDKWHVVRSLRRGEAPQDSETATAAIEWAESYQRQGPGYSALIRWFPFVVVVACGAASIFFAIDGDAPVAILNALIVLINLAHLMLNPMVRPQKVAQSLEASRRIVASSE
jgi:hypothetical protein